MSNELIYALIGEAELPQIEQLWADGISDEVFLPFFACLIANLADEEMGAWYYDFVDSTDIAFRAATATGSKLIGGDRYWDHPYHKIMAEKIAQANFLDDDILHTAFPLATHAGYEYLVEQADLLSMSLQDFAKAKLHTIAPALPAWANLVVAPNVVSQVSVTSLVNKTLQNDLGIATNSVDDDVFLVEHLSNPIEEPADTDIEFSDEDFIIGAEIPDDVKAELPKAIIDNHVPPTNIPTTKANEQLALDDVLDFEESTNITSSTVISAPEPSNVTIPKSLADELDELNRLAAMGKPYTGAVTTSTPTQDYEIDLSTPTSAPLPIDLDAPIEPLAPIAIKKPKQEVSRPIPAPMTSKSSSPILDELDDGHQPIVHDKTEQGIEKEEERRVASITRPKDDFGLGEPISKKQKSGNGALKIALPILLLLALGGGGFWYYQNHLSVPEPTVSVSVVDEPIAPPAPLPVQSLPPSHLLLTVDENGGLYACRAELGNDGLLQQVVGLLQTNFSNTVCAMDVNTGVSQDMIGLNKLTSVIGLLKTSPFASLELAGDTVWIHSPNPDEIARLVQDMGALMEGAVKVLPRPALNVSAEIDASIAKGNSVLTALAQNADAHSLARAMSVPIFDLSGGVVPEANRLLLAAAAERLKAKPETRLIIAVHSDDIGDKAQARTQTQTQANLVKSALMEMGVSDFQLVAKGVGSDFPIMDNHTELGKFKNRRVEFLVYDDGVFNALGAPAVQEQQAAAEAAAKAEAEAAAKAEAEAQAAELQAQQQMQQQAQMQAMQQPPQPTYGVVNGQIVEQGLPQANPPAQFAPIPAPPPISISGGDIDEDLLRPIGSEGSKGMSSQVQ